MGAEYPQLQSYIAGVWQVGAHLEGTRVNGCCWLHRMCWSLHDVAVTGQKLINQALQRWGAPRTGSNCTAVSYPAVKTSLGSVSPE